MKSLIFVIILSTVTVLNLRAQYNYELGNLQVNNITYKITKSAPFIILKDVSNYRFNVPTTHADIECGEAHFGKKEWKRIENVFRQVFSASRRLEFNSFPIIQLFICGDAAGYIKEVVFQFHENSLVTPQELYQLETGLKALPALIYSFPADCSGINYRITNAGIDISKL